MPEKTIQLVIVSNDAITKNQMLASRFLKSKPMQKNRKV